MNYNKIVEQCFFHAEHVGTLDTSELNTVMCSVGDRRQGASLDLYLACSTQGDILAARFQAYGNPYLIAGLEWLCTRLQGGSLSQHPCLDYQEIVRQLAIPSTQYPVAVLIEQGYRILLQKMNDRLEEKHDEC